MPRQCPSIRVQCTAHAHRQSALRLRSHRLRIPLPTSRPSQSNLVSVLTRVLHGRGSPGREAMACWVRSGLFWYRSLAPKRRPVDSVTPRRRKGGRLAVLSCGTTCTFRDSIADSVLDPTSKHTTVTRKNDAAPHIWKVLSVCKMRPARPHKMSWIGPE